MTKPRRGVDKGFCTLFLPATVPWQPYHLDLYDPRWRLAEEAGVSVNFQIFSGNLAMRCDFASVGDLDQTRFDLARKVIRDEAEANGEELLTVTTLGAAAGMSPIVELIGSGVIDKFPDLQFDITEAGCGDIVDRLARSRDTPADESRHQGVLRPRYPEESQP